MSTSFVILQTHENVFLCVDSFNRHPRYGNLMYRSMKEFIFLFRQPSYDYRSSSRENMPALVQKCQEWSVNIARKGKLTSNGLRLRLEGKVLKANHVTTDGPFVEIREMLGSFVVVQANNLEEATALAHGPTLEEGGFVKIRPVYGTSSK
ncbi:MAG: YciI family protein [Flavisolibacter sp.]